MRAMIENHIREFLDLLRHGLPGLEVDAWLMNRLKKVDFEIRSGGAVLCRHVMETKQLATHDFRMAILRALQS